MGEEAGAGGGFAREEKMKLKKYIGSDWEKESKKENKIKGSDWKRGKKKKVKF